MRRRKGKGVRACISSLGPETSCEKKSRNALLISECEGWPPFRCRAQLAELL